MNKIFLISIAILLGGGLLFCYGKAIIIAIRINGLFLQPKRFQEISLKQGQFLIVRLAIYLMLGGICLASIIFLIFGGDALSLGGCLAFISFFLGIFYGISALWRLRLINRMLNKSQYRDANKDE